MSETELERHDRLQLERVERMKAEETAPTPVTFSGFELRVICAAIKMAGELDVLPDMMLDPAQSVLKKIVEWQRSER